MKIGDALGGMKRLYVETSPFIYYIEENPLYIAKMDQIIDLIEQTPVQGICSVVTLTEVLPIPLRTGNVYLVQAYRDILLNSEEFQCVPLDQRTASTAADLRAKYKFKTPDALHIATAIEYHCDAFLTNDKDLKQVTEIRILVLDELELDTKNDG